MLNNQSLLQKCLQDNFPIVRENTGKLILSFIKENNYQTMLEIGTGYGYSADLWLQNSSLATIISLEKLSENYEIACQYLGNNKRLTLINSDAFVFEPQQKFDIIFVDGPKSHQEMLVEKYLQYLNDNGMMIIDNLYLNKIRTIPSEKLTKNQIKLINKIDEFNHWLKHDLKGYKFSFYDLDDGVGVIVKDAK